MMCDECADRDELIAALERDLMKAARDMEGAANIIKQLTEGTTKAGLAIKILSTKVRELETVIMQRDKTIKQMNTAFVTATKINKFSQKLQN